MRTAKSSEHVGCVPMHGAQHNQARGYHTLPRSSNRATRGKRATRRLEARGATAGGGGAVRGVVTHRISARATQSPVVTLPPDGAVKGRPHTHNVKSTPPSERLCSHWERTKDTHTLAAATAPLVLAPPAASPRFFLGACKRANAHPNAAEGVRNQSGWSGGCQ